MSKLQKFLDHLWRVDVILILIVTGAIVFGIAAFLLVEFKESSARNRAADAGIHVANPNENAKFFLENASLVAGTNVMRANLLRDSGNKFSSGSGSGETRNILFIVPGEKTARWLLPDNNHIITENSDITDGKDPEKGRVIATVVLVKSPADDLENATGQLLLFDPPGKKILEVADNVRQIHVAALNGTELTILYERDRRLVFAAFDPQTIVKKREEQIEVPLVK